MAITSFFHTTYKRIDAHLCEHIDGIGFSPMPRDPSAVKQRAAHLGRRVAVPVAVRGSDKLPGLYRSLTFYLQSCMFLVEPRGFERLTSAVQRRRDSLLELSVHCKIAANARIFCMTLFPNFQVIYSGCCTVTAPNEVALDLCKKRRSRMFVKKVSRNTSLGDVPSSDAC